MLLFLIWIFFVIIELIVCVCVYMVNMEDWFYIIDLSNVIVFKIFVIVRIIYLM